MRQLRILMSNNLPKTTPPEFSIQDLNLCSDFQLHAPALCPCGEHVISEWPFAHSEAQGGLPLLGRSHQPTSFPESQSPEHFFDGILPIPLSTHAEPPSSLSQVSVYCVYTVYFLVRKTALIITSVRESHRKIQPRCKRCSKVY
jgi:hypothetical protein